MSTMRIDHVRLLVVHFAECFRFYRDVIGLTVNVKDILAHLADWEAHMPVWLAAARAGDPVAEIETGLNWKQFDDFNARTYWLSAYANHDLWAKTHIRKWMKNS